MPTGDDHQLPQGYTFRETLSRGRTITVVRAHSARHGEVVVKSWTEPLSDDAARAAFEREARLHESLSPDAAPHPNIVAFVEASTDWELPWIATRPGGSTLSDVLAKRALGREEALRISRDILDGLSVLHERRLVHGDLTPRNILIYNGRATLCDLGLAGTPGELPLTPQVGTPEYMAPELLADPGRGPDCRSDVYAAGRVLGDVLDGQCLPPRMEHLVYARAVSARPSDRPSGAGALARAFRRAEPQSPRPTTRRRIAIFAGSLALALVAGSAGSAWRQGVTRPRG